MNALRGVCAALGLSLAAAPALAQPAPAGPQPPMNDFTQAFYKCDAGLAFMMSYDGDKPTTADMATNDDGRHYALKRTAATGGGVQFAGGGARFWTDGKTVVVEGTKTPFKNCRIKAN